ncbi:MAG: hypothetical protein CLLPBCKN_006847 [Chroococcidiopsis cubana SAG 39.79]|nr:hypothetical protein [Chroococcidiopsis cubana SAG 39.79]
MPLFYMSLLRTEISQKRTEMFVKRVGSDTKTVLSALAAETWITPITLICDAFLTSYRRFFNLGTKFI